MGVYTLFQLIIGILILSYLIVKSVEKGYYFFSIVFGFFIVLFVCILQNLLF